MLEALKSLTDDLARVHKLFFMSLEFKGVGKRFGARPVLRSLSAQIEVGECVAVVGRNGSGKSTLLRLVAGLLAPSRGEIFWKGASTRENCALSAPDAPLTRELSCLENLQFFNQSRKSDAVLRELLQKWELKGRENDLAGDLSSGLRARLGLCVADFHAQSGSPILLLDEPSANLDETGRILVENLIGEQKSRGIVLLATNDARDLELCGRILRVSD